MFELHRNYGNGYAVKVTGAKMVEVIEALAQADEMFADTKASALINGQLVESGDIRIQTREVESNGRKVRYYEQVCVEPGPLQWYKRHLGQYQDGSGMYIHRGPPKTNPERYTLGKNGWAKYNGDGSGNYRQGNDYGQGQPQGQQGYQQVPQGQQGYQQPQGQQYQQPQQRPPQYQQQPQPGRPAPQQGYPVPPQQAYVNPHAAPAGVDEIPF
jgi:hypothetical protein